MSNSSGNPEFMDARQLRERLNPRELVVIDVRSAEEFAIGHIDGAINIPAGELPSRIGELPSNTTIVTVCNLGGARSCGAAQQLRDFGCSSVFVLRGGFRGWRDE